MTERSVAGTTVQVQELDRPDLIIAALVAFCIAWALVGAWLSAPWPTTPSVSPGDSVWLLAACPVVFWLGRRFGGAARAAAVPLVLALAALLLVLGPREVHPNDQAALLALVVPWWLVPALLPPGRHLAGESRAFVVRLGSVVVALACAAMLWSTASRGGLLAAVLGTAAGLVLATRNRRRLVLVLLLLAVLLPTVWSVSAEIQSHDRTRAWIRDWILDHDAEGVTWNHLTSGRPQLWRQASRVIGDFPLFGAGAGTYGILVPDVYPPPLPRIDPPIRPPRVADAHHLYLETAVAFGVPAMLAFLALCWVGLWRLADRALRQQGERATADGLRSAAAFGGLLAYLVHGLGDCAAPGSVVYAAGWAALGFACRAPTRRAARSWLHRGLLLGGLVGAAGMLALATVRLLPDERLHRQAVRAVLRSPAHPESAVELRRLMGGDDALRDDPCRHAWWRERLAVAAGFSSAGETFTVARCAPHLLRDVMALSAFDAARAAAAYEAFPEHPDALLWRLWTTTADPDLDSDADRLAHGYFHYFAMRPYDAEIRMEFLRRLGPRWLERHRHLALATLAQACAHGDPGANACYGAGNLAHQLDLGDAVADSFYLASEWPGARRLASPR